MSPRTPEEIQERISNIVTTELALGVDANTPWWWLSYAGEREGFMGVCIVQANSMGGAVYRAKERHISPGGQVLGAEYPCERAGILPRAVPESLPEQGGGGVAQHAARAAEGGWPVNARVLSPLIGAADVVQQLGCSRSTAYALLRQAAGRTQGDGRLLRVPVEQWQRFLQREIACDSSSTSSPTRKSGGRGSTTPTASASGSPRPAATIVPLKRAPWDGAGRRIQITRPRTGPPSPERLKHS